MIHRRTIYYVAQITTGFPAATLRKPEVPIRTEEKVECPILKALRRRPSHAVERLAHGGSTRFRMDDMQGAFCVKGERPVVCPNARSLERDLLPFPAVEIPESVTPLRRVARSNPQGPIGAAKQ